MAALWWGRRGEKSSSIAPLHAPAPPCAPGCAPSPLHSYWLRYWVLAWVELPYYAFRRRRWGALAACLATECGYLAGVRALWALSPMATKWVFIVPFFISSFALMFGNW